MLRWSSSSWSAGSESAGTGAGRPPERRLPGPDDADLGWVETVDEEGEPTFAPRRRDRSGVVPPAAGGRAVGAVLFAYAYRVDREAGWSSVPSAGAGEGGAALHRRGGPLSQGIPSRVDLRRGLRLHRRRSDAAGVAFIPRGLAYLEPSVCRSLYRITFERKVGARDDAAFAITVLAHEAVHLRGVRNEVETECQALQEGVALSERLGLDDSTARALMHFQRDRDLSDDKHRPARLPPAVRTVKAR